MERAFDTSPKCDIVTNHRSSIFPHTSLSNHNNRMPNTVFRCNSLELKLWVDQSWMFLWTKTHVAEPERSNSWQKFLYPLLLIRRYSNDVILSARCDHRIDHWHYIRQPLNLRIFSSQTKWDSWLTTFTDWCSPWTRRSGRNAVVQRANWFDGFVAHR
jgi:hypothetical protein